MFFPIVACLCLLAGNHVAAQSVKLVNRCESDIAPRVESSSAEFTVEQPVTLAHDEETTVHLPKGFFGRICSDQDCKGSMAEFSFAREKVYYDISNILGYTIPHTISTSCGIASCLNSDCECTEAFGPGDEGHHGGGCVIPAGREGPLRVCDDMGSVTVTYCASAPEVQPPLLTSHAEL
ncbi:hypothetical protein BDV98DRAFT_568989 [Pterulicium gracile]|uniref:Uncharacterized protein n=1 Tax=Pterulicium gracile TaxID=1884261 RepID=A0A5C3QFS3_9AGAR|nr:hypothetical protein BDV98DRAFT_568989 [Pterula gracilis]